LFKRGVSTAGVAAAGGEAPSSQSPLEYGVSVRVSQSIPVAHVLSVLSGVGRCVGSVASKYLVGPTLSASVASAFVSSAYPTARTGSPASTLPLVLRSLRRRAAAAKVSRGRRRLGEATGQDQSERVAFASYVASRIEARASKSSGVQLRQLSLSASCGGSSGKVASASVLSELRQSPARARFLQ
jgi:hypothetical protein